MAHTKEFAKKRIEKSAQKALMGSGYGDVFGSSAKKKAIARKMKQVKVKTHSMYKGNSKEFHD